MLMQIPKTCLVSSALTILFLALTSFAQQSGTQSLFAVEKDGKWGFIDSTGQIKIPFQVDGANKFREGLALVRSGKKKVFIDTNGKEVIAPEFDIVNDFSEGIAAVNIGQVRNSIGLIANPGDADHGAFIDHTGKTVFDVPLDVTVGFHEGLVGVLLRGTVTYYDRSGRKIPISTAYGPKTSSFSEGLLPIEVKDKWGYVDKTGKIVIEPKFEDGESFHEGLAPVKVRGEVVWCPADSSGNRSGSSMMWGYTDKTGRMVIPQVLNSAEPFSEGLAAVSKCDEAYFIDKTGKTVISGNFRYASSFSGGLARVSMVVNDAIIDGYVDRTGRVVWPPR